MRNGTEKKREGTIVIPLFEADYKGPYVTVTEAV